MYLSVSLALRSAPVYINIPEWNECDILCRFPEIIPPILSGQEVCGCHRLSHGEKAGRDFLCLSALLHALSVPSTPAALRPARHDALIFGWMLYTTRSFRALELIVLYDPGRRESRLGAAGRPNGIIRAASGTAARDEWCMPQRQGPAASLPSLFSVEKTAEAPGPQKTTQRPPQTRKGAVLCVFRRPCPPRDT